MLVYAKLTWRIQGNYLFICKVTLFLSYCFYIEVYGYWKGIISFFIIKKHFDIFSYVSLFINSLNDQMKLESSISFLNNI